MMRLQFTRLNLEDSDRPVAWPVARPIVQPVVRPVAYSPSRGPSPCPLGYFSFFTLMTGYRSDDLNLPFVGLWTSSFCNSNEDSATYVNVFKRHLFHIIG